MTAQDYDGILGSAVFITPYDVKCFRCGYIVKRDGDIGLYEGNKICMKCWFELDGGADD